MIPSRPAGARLPAARRGVAHAVLALALLGSLAACGTSEQSAPLTSGRASGSGAAAPSVAATPTPPTPTPLPTPQYTNAADPDLTALIPAEIAGVTVQIPPVDEFAITPGDIGEAYGELGLRFRTLQLAYVPRPRSLSLFAVRMDEPLATTEELEPHLATAGQYVGIALPEREPWELQTIDGRVVWVRPEDDATALGTMIYTWTAGEYLFLMIGVDDTLNRAMFAALPGEAAPTPTPRPSRSPAGGASASPAGS